MPTDVGALEPAAPSADPGAVTAAARTTLCLESSLQIKDVDGVHRSLVALLERGAAVTVDISHVGAVDTAGAQLLLSFQREAEKRGQTVEFCGHSTVFAHALTSLGLNDAIRHAPARAPA